MLNVLQGIVVTVVTGIVVTVAIEIAAIVATENVVTVATVVTAVMVATTVASDSFQVFKRTFLDKSPGKGAFLLNIWIDSPPLLLLPILYFYIW
jgi:uncharacterized membrane protein YgaE (UPF0421/DUF939 family)